MLCDSAPVAKPASADQGKPAGHFGAFACLSGEPAAEFQSDQRQADAGRADHCNSGRLTGYVPKRSSTQLGQAGFGPQEPA